MRRLAQLMLLVVVVVLVGATVVLFQKYRRASADYLDMKSAEEAVRAQYAEAFNAIAEIQDSLTAIRIGEGAVRLQPQGLQSERRLTEPSRREVLESIAQLNASIQRTKERIRDLEADLRMSGMRVAGLRKMVAGLKSSLAERETQVGQLSGQVNELQTQVAGLQVTVQQSQDTILAKNQAIEEGRRELGTVYYVVGTKRQLASSGVIVAKGGVLGLGKTVQLSGRFDDHLFTAMDTDQQNVIRAPASKVKVLSPQPVSSYELRVDGDQVELRILDPAEFRKVKHVVIMTA